ncbi:tryptophan synthase beta subunit-like PLP-dependent enzyme [Rhypophila sp. PSN 637]
MSLSDHPKAYGTAALTAAFAAGILVTLGFKDFYPDLERRYQLQRKENKRRTSTSDSRRRSSVFFGGGGPVALEDHDTPDITPSIVDGIEGCIGNTPLIRIRSLSEATGCDILVKAEFLNGAGMSPKDRVALNMIQKAEEQGLLVPGRGDTIYEGTVGSTGISLATLAKARGYHAHICMPSDQSAEKVDLLHHLGATVERVTPAPIVDPNHYVNIARRRAAEHNASSETPSRGFFADQFESEANYEAHMLTTGPEIYAQTGGKIDAFVAGAGTGGTLSGVTRYLKVEKQLNNLRAVLADPYGSGGYNRIRSGVMYSPTEKEGTRRRSQVDSIVEGIGINRVTLNWKAGEKFVDDAVRVTDEQACRMARWLVQHDGIFVGSSSAVNCVAAVVTALGMPTGSVVVTVLCDPGMRHLSKFYKRVNELGLEENEEEESKHVVVAEKNNEGDLVASLGIEETLKVKRRGGGRSRDEEE